MSRAVRGLLVAGGLAILFFFAYVTAIRLAFMLVYFGVLLVAVCWTWARVAGRGLEVTRGAQEGAYEVGQEFREKMEVSNSSIVGVPWVVVEDRAGIPGYEASRVFSLPGRGSRRWTTQGRFTRRGRYTLGPIRLTTGDPFGFFQRTQVVGVPAMITVYPRLVDVIDLLPGSTHSSGDSRVFGRFSDSPPDALGIREHDPSDGFNRIHWPSTARLGRPMSRSFERYEGADTLVVLDLAVGGHRGRDGTSTLEHSVSLAASVAMAAAQRGQSVALRCNDAGGTAFPAGSGPNHLRKILEFLAVAQATGTRPLASALPGSSGRPLQQSVVVITPAQPGIWVDALAAGRDGGRRTTVLRVGGEAGDRPRLRTIGEITWWDLATDNPEPAPLRRAS
ncbi:MAG TPA: DUF58 domain-containing protein [Candidatus Dormibacteraeota bacterium]|nr:DUF58 domain-containing protein [Candidatus Dormibacteraeota bacterium]